ncbi:hypothetical protein H072_6420 [Dactylellina haptotyla CBS 200.50]|uniref:protein-tyrosine-phosphatase n=1 Tax=Dactylellina haptotyla (strain CBS 200.50) TaxID=1284197 RepID=S8BXG0_DACHA|nr:hypothetical protein H072_6420 [Dactylellina haptotyla CBS 200.50]
MNMSQMGDMQLYISGRPDILKDANITHILSVIDEDLDPTLFAGYEHLQIEEDDSDEVDLIRQFKRCNEFIEKGIASGGGVLVHCLMGISRSVTITAGYLIYKNKWSAEQALEFIRDSRSIAHPNFGFREQLDIYARNLAQAEVALDTVVDYKRYLFRRDVNTALVMDMVPRVGEYAVVDVQSLMEGEMVVKCKKCRLDIDINSAPLALSRSIIEHEKTDSRDPEAVCERYFVDPIAWMKPELGKSLMEGIFRCPGCSEEVGAYAWSGTECNCGGWVIDVFPAMVIWRAGVELHDPRVPN